MSAASSAPGSRRRRWWLCGILPALLAGWPFAPAAAQQTGPVFLHEVSPGATGDPAAQYVALLVDGASGPGPWQLVPEDAFGDPLPTLATLDGAELAPGFVLLATPEAADAYGLTPDFLLDRASLPTGGAGRLCLFDGAAEIDCVGFGSVAENGLWGLTAPAVLPGQALVRDNYTGVNSTDWVQAPLPLDPAQYLAGGQEGDGGFLDGGDGGDAGALDGGLFDGGDGGPFDAGFPDGGDAGEDGDGGPPTGGQTGDLPDGGVVVTPGDGTGGGGIGGGEVPDRDTGGCVAAGGSAGVALLVLFLAGRMRRR